MASFRHRHRVANGYFLWEVLLVCTIILLGMTVFFPYIGRHDAKRDADVLVRELAVDIQRMRQYSMSNGLADSDNWNISCSKERYYVIRQYMIQKERPYPKGVTVIASGASRKDIFFDEKGRPTHAMQVTISVPAISYTKKIILAAQTGRIRIE